MFEDMAVAAVQLLIVTFWIVIVFLALWGAWWLRSLKHVKY
jgi:hypothetical protein